MPICDPSLGEIVWRELDIDPVTHQDADAISTHAAGDRRQHNVLAVVYPHLKKSVRLFVDNNTRQFDQFFFHLVTCIRLVLFKSKDGRHH